MIKLFEQALEAVRVRPAGIQDEIARILLQLSGSNAGPVPLDRRAPITASKAVGKVLERAKGFRPSRLFALISFRNFRGYVAVL